MLVKLVWPDGHIEEIEHAPAPHATSIEVPATAVEAHGVDCDVVVTSSWATWTRATSTRFGCTWTRTCTS